MIRVLVNAYACSPTWGSEPGMGWNWVSSLAKFCELFIITEGEWKSEIEKVLHTHPYKCNLHFYYLPVPGKVRKMCWNQGDWRFYYYYDKWQERAYKLAEQIVQQEKIDIIHQLNMVGFREPGYLWKIRKPFIWGPIGGMEELPKKYLDGAPIKQRLLLYVKDFISDLQLKYSAKINGAFNKADSIIAAVPAVQHKVKEFRGLDSILISETGCYDLEVNVKNKCGKKYFDVLWVGRFIYTKRLDIALKTFAYIKSLPNIHLHIVGTGSDDDVRFYHEMADKYGLKNVCVWHGKVDNEKVHKMMKDADLFFFTSIMEATSTVIPEAINNCLPILCFDTCGFGPIVTEKIGKKIKMTTPEESVRLFAHEIEYLYNHKELLYEMSLNCKDVLKELLWVNKAERVYELYKRCLS